MRGSIVKPKGRNGYYVVVDQVLDGKRKRKWHPAGKTMREAEDVLSDVVGRAKQGVYIAPGRATVTTYLTETWLPAARATVKPSTAELYATIIDAYVCPHLGDVKLRDVKGSHLNSLYAALSSSGRRDGKPLAPKTIRNVHTLLHRAFRDAVKWELLIRNPADAADPPKVARAEVSHWDAETVRSFLVASEADRLYPLWHVIATTGARRGEALALRWSDVDLESGRASIARTLSWVAKAPTFTEPKSAASRRVLPLPAETVAVLRHWRKRQFEERLAAGELYADHGLVFAQENGAPLPPKRITKAFVRAVERAGLPHLTVHGLRHSFATVALGAGVLTKVVADVLGHSSASITADIYSHTTDPMTRDASDRVASAMFGTRS